MGVKVSNLFKQIILAHSDCIWPFGDTWAMPISFHGLSFGVSWDPLRWEVSWENGGSRP